MKVVSINDKIFVPASHEDPKDPGVVKKVLLGSEDFDPSCQLKMLNYALIKPGKSFAAHFHQTLEEFFYVTSGKAKIKMKTLTAEEIDLYINQKKSFTDLLADAESQILEKDTAVLIPPKTIHIMENIGDKDLIYLAVGAASGKGETVVFD